MKQIKTILQGYTSQNGIRIYSEEAFYRMLEGGENIVPYRKGDEPITILQFLLEGFIEFSPQSKLGDSSEMFSQLMKVGRHLIAEMFTLWVTWLPISKLVEEYDLLLRCAFGKGRHLWNSYGIASIESFSMHVEELLRESSRSRQKTSGGYIPLGYGIEPYYDGSSDEAGNLIRSNQLEVY
jgi:hypothetical protein